jgi:hypothetical protein
MMTSKRSYWFGFVVFVFALALTLAVASVAVAYVDEFGGSAARASAPYTEPYAGTTNIGPHVPSDLVKPFAPYTEKYAGTDNIGPHVPSDLIKGPSAPFTEPKPFWGQYLER